MYGLWFVSLLIVGMDVFCVGVYDVGCSGYGVFYWWGVIWGGFVRFGKCDCVCECFWYICGYV